jgi:glycosyltransferase involved in cell wall biosynthesis
MLNQIRKIFADRKNRRPVVVAPASKARGAVVISYISWPLREGWDLPRARGHTNAFEVVAMTEAWRDLGFRVEVVDHRNESYFPPPDAAVVIDLHGDMERWLPALRPDCMKILHATGSHWLAWNTAELARLSGVRNRKGVALRPRRQNVPSASSELVDRIVVLGNDYTSGSFLFTGKPVMRIPISSAYEFEWPRDRDFEQARRKFLWVGSYGMVHKGLDLVLDAFASLPDLQLTVCGRPEKEADFHKLYEKQLRHSPNIHFHGWLDMGSPDFGQIARTHGTIIYPSCAEGGAGSVIHCLHAGLLPACTHESSVDLGAFGVLIEEGSVEAVRSAAATISAFSPTEIETRARAAWEHARSAHTRALFKLNYGRFASELAVRSEL